MREWGNAGMGKCGNGGMREWGNAEIYRNVAQKKLTCLIYFNLKTKRAITPKLPALHSVLSNLNFDIRPVQFRAILTERAAFKLE
jgi:hypothetical protein